MPQLLDQSKEIGSGAKPYAAFPEGPPSHDFRLQFSFASKR